MRTFQFDKLVPLSLLPARGVIFIGYYFIEHSFLAKSWIISKFVCCLLTHGFHFEWILFAIAILDNQKQEKVIEVLIQFFHFNNWGKIIILLHIIKSMINTLPLKYFPTQNTKEWLNFLAFFISKLHRATKIYAILLFMFFCVS